MKETAEWQFSKIEKQHGLVADEGLLSPYAILTKRTTASLIKKLGIQVVSGVLLFFCSETKLLVFFSEKELSH